MTDHLTRPRTAVANRSARHPVLATATIAGALLFLAGQALLPSLPEAWGPAFAGMLEHRDRLMAARLLTGAGAFLLVPAAVGIARLLPNGTRGARVVAVGATLFGIGTFSNAVSQVVAGYSTYAATAPGIDQPAGRDVLHEVGAGLVGFPIGFWSIPVFALGTLVIAVGLLRSGVVATWIPVVLIIGDVMAGAFAGRGYVVALTQAPVTVALIALGLLVWSADFADSADG